MSFFHRYLLAQFQSARNDAGLLELCALFGVICEVFANGTDCQLPQKQSVWDHHGEDQKAQCVKTFQNQRYWYRDEQEHQLVEQSACYVSLAPPVIGFDRAYFIRGHPPVPPYPRMPSNRGCQSFDEDHNRNLATGPHPGWFE